MKKPVKIVLIVIIVFAAVLIGGFKYMQYSTKQHSPEREVTATVYGTSVELYYNSPSVKGREIFGELVPYGQVWRTGANEPSTVTFGSEVTIEGKSISAGTYSIWTIPGPETWDIILNSGSYDWGMGWDGQVPRDPELDVVIAKATIVPLAELQEDFVIRVNEQDPALEFVWEYVMVALPFMP